MSEGICLYSLITRLEIGQEQYQLRKSEIWILIGIWKKPILSLHWHWSLVVTFKRERCVFSVLRDRKTGRIKKKQIRDQSIMFDVSRDVYLSSKHFILCYILTYLRNKYTELAESKMDWVSTRFNNFLVSDIIIHVSLIE